MRTAAWSVVTIEHWQPEAIPCSSYAMARACATAAIRLGASAHIVPRFGEAPMRRPTLMGFPAAKEAV